MTPLNKAIGIGLALLAALGLAAWIWVAQPCDRSASASQVLVEIPQGSSVSDIAEILRNERLVRGRGAFVVAALLSGTYGKFQAGWYELSQASSPVEIAHKIARGEVAQIKVTIPEGANLRQIACTLEEAKVCGADEFIAAAVPATVTNRVTTFTIPAETLEGYLFPDTYFFALGSPAERVVAAMVDRLEDVFLDFVSVGPPAMLGSLDAVVTLASLVEGEAKWDDERALIAGVLANRLKTGMRLQCDATVQYALGEHKPRLTYEDLKVESPYNTYLRPGLPPGPICSPGLASLKAALHPEPTDYLYYVAKPDGHHIFSRTYEEHKAAIAKIRGQR